MSTRPQARRRAGAGAGRPAAARRSPRSSRAAADDAGAARFGRSGDRRRGRHRRARRRRAGAHRRRLRGLRARPAAERSARSPRCRCRWCVRCGHGAGRGLRRAHQPAPAGRAHLRPRPRRPPRRRRAHRRGAERGARFLNRQVQAGDLGRGGDDDRRRRRLPGLHRGRARWPAPAIDRFVGRQPGETAALQQTAEDAFVARAAPDPGAAGAGAGRGPGRRRPVGEPGGRQPGRVGVRRPQRRSDGGAAQLDGDHRRRRDHRQRRRRRRGAGAGPRHLAHAAHGRRRARRHPRPAQGDPLFQRGPAGDAARRRPGRRADAA